MTELSLRLPRISFAPWLYASAIFLSAALVFLVQPMVARMILPQLGGSPGVWNASMAFFQMALLVGYAYAHALQRLRSPRLQGAVHLVMLIGGLCFLPLQLSSAFGAPPAEAPSLWLLAVLAASVGAPFAVLSATAPLLQAWYAKSAGEAERSNPYVLYAASNLGSLLALAAYPLVVEPLSTLKLQAWLWTTGYAGFGLLALAVAWSLPATVKRPDTTAKPTAKSALTWRERLIWIGLAALPSSLLLGVTNHISTDVASAPFLWVVPLGAYLLTFVIAFSDRPLLSRDRALFWHGGLATLALVTLMADPGGWLIVLFIHIAAFFLSALVCHHALAARRPPTDRLTEFYLLMSLGGVVGGAFTAFVAPVMFDVIWEYPAALVLAGLVRPWGRGPLGRREMALLAVAVCSVACAAWLAANDVGVELGRGNAYVRLALVPAALGIFFLRDRGLIFAGLLAILAFGPAASGVRSEASERGFFGVHTVALKEGTGPAGDIRLLFHGTTLHGAQLIEPSLRCRPITYYAPGAPIHQAFVATQARVPSARIGVTGLGAGSVAAFTRPTDTLRFFEIDPLVLALAQNRKHFTYLSDCAQGRVDTVLGDARLTLTREPEGGFDQLVMDAFSSDSVPTHLLTREAMRLYLSKLKPDGLLVVHVSNRHLSLHKPVAAALEAEGAQVLILNYVPPEGTEALTAAASDVIAASRDPSTLASLRAQGWKPVPANNARPWSDDYINLVGAIWEGARR